MKSEKITESRARWYDDACGAALAMELVGERWSMLIARELMYGPRRFGEIRAALPGLSANVLTQRLEGMAAVGILARRQLPPPASVQVYELTSWGYESETAIMALGRWAVRSPLHDPSLHMSGASFMMSLRTMIDHRRAAAFDATLGFCLGVDGFRARLAGGDLSVERGEPGPVDLLFEAATAWPLLCVIYGREPIAAHEASGALRLTGDHALAERVVTLFPLPPKAAAG